MLAGMSAAVPSGIAVDMPAVMLPDILLDALGVRLLGMLAIKSKGMFMPATKRASCCNVKPEERASMLQRTVQRKIRSASTDTYCALPITNGSSSGDTRITRIRITIVRYYRESGCRYGHLKVLQPSSPPPPRKNNTRSD